MKYLGESFDIHTSSRGLVFPHHENENAIAAALTGKSLARYWVHCEPVQSDDHEMGSNGSELSLQDLIDQGFSAREVRYWLLSSHYRKPVTLSLSRLRYAKRSLNRLDSCIQALGIVKQTDPYAEADQLLYDIKQGFTSAMDDDLNTPAALASLFKIIKRINILILENRLDAVAAAKITDAFRNIDAVLKIFDFKVMPLDQELTRLIQEREKARKEKNWALADSLRKQLQARGVALKDGKI
jgi:cysteinyl-tRNA synthetase